MECIVSTHKLYKKYKKHIAINGVEMSISKGSIYGLIGKNGAGKSTLLKIIAGLSMPSSGNISSIPKDKMGVLIESPALYQNLTAYENLKLKCIALGIKDYGCINETLKVVGLFHDNKKVKNYSLGMKQRLGIGLALIGNPQLLILDEPINGLDPQGILEIRNVIIKLNGEKNITIIISSHILEELSKLATDFGFINQGMLLRELSQKELDEKCGERLEIVVDNINKAKEALGRLEIRDYEVNENQGSIYIYERIEESAEIGTELVKSAVKIKTMTCAKQSLEEFYFDLMEETEYA